MVLSREESAAHRDQHSFPTRRSSDLAPLDGGNRAAGLPGLPSGGRGTTVGAKRVAEALEHAHAPIAFQARQRSEEHTSELQSHVNLVCRLLLEKKNRPINYSSHSTRQ